MGIRKWFKEKWESKPREFPKVICPYCGGYITRENIRNVDMGGSRIMSTCPFCMKALGYAQFH